MNEIYENKLVSDLFYYAKFLVLEILGDLFRQIRILYSFVHVCEDGKNTRLSLPILVRSFPFSLIVIQNVIFREKMLKSVLRIMNASFLFLCIFVYINLYC